VDHRQGLRAHPPFPPWPATILLPGSTSVPIHNLGAARWAPSGDAGTCGCTLGEPLAAGARTVFIGGPSGPLPDDMLPKACGYLRKGGTVEAPLTEFDRFRAPTKLGPAVATKHTFPGYKKPSDVLVHEVEVKGRKVKVFVPPGHHSPTADQVAKSLGTLPEGQLDSIKDVTVSPSPFPGDKDFKDGPAAGTGDPSGHVTFYPAAGHDQAG